MLSLMSWASETTTTLYNQEWTCDENWNGKVAISNSDIGGSYSDGDKILVTVKEKGGTAEWPQVEMKYYDGSGLKAFAESDGTSSVGLWTVEEEYPYIAEFTLTQSMVDKINAGTGLIIAGCDYTGSKIEWVHDAAPSYMEQLADAITAAEGLPTGAGFGTYNTNALSAAIEEATAASTAADKTEYSCSIALTQLNNHLLAADNTPGNWIVAHGKNTMTLDNNNKVVISSNKDSVNFTATEAVGEYLVSIGGKYLTGVAQNTQVETTTEITSAQRFKVAVNGDSFRIYDKDAEENQYLCKGYQNKVVGGAATEDASEWTVAKYKEWLLDYYLDSYKNIETIDIDNDATLIAPSEYSPKAVNAAIDKVNELSESNTIAEIEDVINNKVPVLDNYIALSEAYGYPLSVIYNMYTNHNDADASFGTIILPINWTIPENWEVYTCSSLDGNTLGLTQTSAVSKNTPYIVKTENTEDQKFQFIGYSNNAATEDQTPTGSLITGVLTEGGTQISNGYVLQNLNDVIGFYKVEGELTVPCNKCYLTVGEEAPVFYGFNIMAENENATGIQAINALLSGKAEIYDINGNKLNDLQKGINVVNGVKVIVK